VVRNRIRRRLREAVRLEIAGFAGSGDLVLHPRGSVLEARFEDLRGEVRKVFARCSG
jgi:ribonuclease P protein component